MEDAHFMIPALPAPWGPTAAFGVFDGHGGDAVAHFCEKFMPQEITRGSSEDVPGSLTRAFHRMDEMLGDPDRLKEVRALSNYGTPKALSAHPDWMGCTAVVCCIDPTQIYVANAGDSRAVLCREGECIPLSEDHKPNMPSERARIIEAGGTVTKQEVGPIVQFRINGHLNLSRSVGDLEYKKNINLQPDEQMICSTPEVQVVERTPGDEFIILACDGIWDVLSSEEVVDFIRVRLLSSSRPSKSVNSSTDPCLSGIVEELLDRCLSRDLAKTHGLGGDNMTAVLVTLTAGGIVEAASPATSERARQEHVDHGRVVGIDGATITPSGFCGCQVVDSMPV